MEPQNIIHDLLHRLIGSFALADGWIDRWQGDDPTSGLYRSRFHLLSQMVTGPLGLLNGISFTSDHICKGEELPFGQAGREPLESLNDKGPDRMRKILREQLGGLLWLLDLQEQRQSAGRIALTLKNGEQTDVLAVVERIHRMVDDYVAQLEALGEPLEDVY